MKRVNMGRSKFPGKPPKTVTRKRIKVLGQPETAQSDSVTVAENIYYGLSLFNETFGDNEKVMPNLPARARIALRVRGRLIGYEPYRPFSLPSLANTTCIRMFRKRRKDAYGADSLAQKHTPNVCLYDES